MVNRVDISEVDERFQGYWVMEDGRLVRWGDGSDVRVYTNGTVQLKALNGIRHNISMHRLVALAFVPNPHGWTFVVFKDGDPTNRRASNLEWSYSAKPVSPKTKEIVFLKESGWGTTQVALEMRVTTQYVNRVWRDYKKRIEE